MVWYLKRQIYTDERYKLINKESQQYLREDETKMCHTINCFYVYICVYINVSLFQKTQSINQSYTEKSITYFQCK